jgi:hypothetical protein
VLCGEGLVLGSDGSTRRVAAGDSLMSWHGSTRLSCLPRDGSSSSGSSSGSEGEGEEMLAVLHFHIPR